jgi:hypothetical protein
MTSATGLALMTDGGKRIMTKSTFYVTVKGPRPRAIVDGGICKGCFFCQDEDPEAVKGADWSTGVAKHVDHPYRFWSWDSLPLERIS